MADQDSADGPHRGRFVTGTVWALLLLGLWLWGRDMTDGGSALGDVSSAGRQMGAAPTLPAAHEPLSDAARPVQVDIDAVGVHAKVVARGLDGHGGVKPPPYSKPGEVGWYKDGPTPGEAGASVLVGHVDTDTRRAVFYPLSSVQPGNRVDVTRADGTVAEFTVEKTDVVPRKDFDAKRVYAAVKPHRAEVKLITCGGTFDRSTHSYTANVVVTAYLTGTHQA
jgi:sortase family protein